MPHPGDDSSVAEPTTDRMIVAVGCLSTELVADIFGYLDGPKDIMQKRRVCKKWKEAVKITIVPLCDFCIASLNPYSALNVMTTEMPNLQQINLRNSCGRQKYSEGEDPNEGVAAVTANYTTHDIEIISNFGKLRVLKIGCAELNGRYPFLFNSFPLLEKLSISDCNFLKWDLEMLAAFPLLKELDCSYNTKCVTGNINSLRVLKDTLEKVDISCTDNIEGNFMDLADFPHLMELDLYHTAITGDIRDIGENDFPSLESLILPKGVYGGAGYEFHRISDGPDQMRALYLLMKRRPALTMSNLYARKTFNKYWYVRLSEDSPDRYESMPGRIRFVKAGCRIGYRWENDNRGSNYCSPCEVNWLDPEPDRESIEYEIYTEELHAIDDQVTMYRGFHQPPTQEEYTRLMEDIGGVASRTRARRLARGND